ncbi:MAG: type IV pili methyl-accepting chemotaxis transducer N-terminal domain-containing protein, partial [Gammaproteobacteria bacterium]|nr:type IV pili methyl-accepting chemotaxis transducer N-terminal domain-containing protein [Gammaproteobacteria bacterium]
MTERALNTRRPAVPSLRRWLARLPLGTSNLIALVLIALLSTLSFWVIQRDLLRQKSEAALMNTAGSQRMLVQRIVLKTNELMTVAEENLEALVSVEIVEQELEPRRNEILGLADRMERNHAALAHGADPRFAEHMTPTIRALYFGPDGDLDARFHSYLAEVRGIAALAPIELAGLHTLEFSRTLGNRTDALLDRFERVTGQYQAEFEASLAFTRLHRQVL